jgi:hypothetical protein
VLTVGDTQPDSAVGPTTDHRRKPDILLEDSRASFTNGDMTYGASNAAAYFAGVVTLLKAAEPDLRTRHLLWFAHQDKTTRVAAGSEDPGSKLNDRTPAPRLGRRLSSLAAALQNPNSPLQFRAPNFELQLGPRPQSSPPGSSRSSQSFYGPMRIRAGDFEFNLPSRSAIADRVAAARRAPGVSSEAAATKPRPPELLRPPHKATDTQPAAPSLVWRTPTREHLAEVVHDKNLKE